MRIKKKIITLVKHVVKMEDAEPNDLNIILTNDDYIQKLNKKFLKRNKPTNVISFPMEEVSEIYISYDQVNDPADLYYYVIHGLLHIAGYNHKHKKEAKAMQKKCSKYMEKCR